MPALDNLANDEIDTKFKYKEDAGCEENINDQEMLSPLAGDIESCNSIPLESTHDINDDKIAVENKDEDENYNFNQHSSQDTLNDQDSTLETNDNFHVQDAISID